MKYSEFSTEDFAGDPLFRKWVLDTDLECEQFWNNFLKQHPQKITEATAAKNFLLSLEQQVQSGFSSRGNEDSVLKRIKEKLAGDIRIEPVGRSLSWHVWAAAASVLLLLGWGWFTIMTPAPAMLSYESNRDQAKTVLIEKVNDAKTPLQLKLADGSLVTLQPESKISYSESFNEESTREVYLSGEAFFEVFKNPLKSFYVYANELTTKVLGTSFNVRAFQNDKSVTVNVLTGKVSVALSDGLVKNSGGGHQSADHILLLPNQKGTLLRKEIRLVKTLVENPVLLDSSARAADHSFVFEAVPVVKVFKTLEQAYGVRFSFDKDVFEKCQFTADLTEESLYDKLKLICNSIEAKYQIVDAQIIITGKGCN